MVLLDVSLQVREELYPGATPLDVPLVLLLPLLEHTVRVELAGVVHLLDVGRGRRSHRHPAQRRNTLRYGREVVEQCRGTILLPVLLYSADLFASRS